MKIDYSCPQCGAPIVLNEADRLLTCPYCRVRHYLVPEDFFRYYLPPDPRLADADRILFVPYGRWRGMYFHLLWPAMESKVIDYNFLAIKETCFPSSLGLRPQTLHLRPALFNRGEESLTPDQDLFDFHRLPTLTGSCSKSPYPTPTIEANAYIGEVKSIIYAPFYRQLPHWIDAILNQPIPTGEKESPHPELHRDASYAWKVSFLPVLCPDCGWDLEAENESCILFCPQCDSAWEPAGKGFKKIGYEVIGAPGNPEDYYGLPFWRFTPLPGSEVYEILTEGRRPKKSSSSPGGEPGSPRSTFWLPAFKISPRLFFLLGKRMTQAQVPGPTRDSPRLPASFPPVTLPAEGAREGLSMIESALTSNPESLPELTPESLAEGCRADLLFIPFLWTPLELVQPQVKLGVSRSALNLAKYI
jgi:predicted RNA-binding Zn-ribbon protein involved in translation (DUF1610 family)